MHRPLDRWERMSLPPESWVGSTACLDVLVKRKSFAHAGIRTPDHSTRSLITMRATTFRLKPFNSIGLYNETVAASLNER